MKLLYCHIENFGSLHDVDVDFANNLHVICEENGWGKSTFAAFIRAMFYGLEGDKKHKITENERKRYMPWQGGLFGGNLIFQIGEKRYNVTRYFQEKESKDQFELRDADTNLISEDYDKYLGEALFQMNRESFLRTVFWDESDNATNATDDIHALVGNLTDHTNDMNNYESACKVLSDEIGGMESKRNSDSIVSLENEITELRLSVRGKSSLEKSVQSYEELLEETILEIAGFEERQKELVRMQQEAGAQQVLREQKAQYESLCNKRKERSDKVQKAKHFFPKEVPGEEELLRLSETGRDYLVAKEKLADYEWAPSLEQKLSGYEERFSEGSVEDRRLDEMLREAEQYEEMKRETDRYRMPMEELEHLAQLNDLFRNDTESVAKMQSLWNEGRLKKMTLSATRTNLEMMKSNYSANSSQKGSSISGLLLAIGFILTVIGIICFIGKFFVPGILLVVFGICFCVGAGVVRSLHKKAKQSAEEASEKLFELERNLKEEEAFVDGCEQTVKSFLTAHGFETTQEQVDYSLKELETLYREWQELSAREKRMEAHSHGEEMQGKEEQLRAFLKQYRMDCLEGDYVKQLYSLKEAMADYNRLRARKEQFQKQKAVCEACEGRFRDFSNRYGVNLSGKPDGEILQLRQKADDYNDCVCLLRDAEKEVCEYEKKVDVESFRNLREESRESLENLAEQFRKVSEKLQNLDKEKTEYMRQLETARTTLEDCQENEILLKELEIQLEQKRRRHSQLLLARKFLIQAKEKMTSQYAGPLQENFCTYYEQITGKSGAEFALDANTNVTRRDYGMQRDLETQSMGYRDLIGICLRFALIDAMYPGEKPFLVLDDPFVNLDDRKQEKAKSFLQKMAEKYQIIYYTCSASRK